MNRPASNLLAVCRWVRGIFGIGHSESVFHGCQHEEVNRQRPGKKVNHEKTAPDFCRRQRGYCRVALGFPVRVLYGRKGHPKNRRRIFRDQIGENRGSGFRQSLYGSSEFRIYGRFQNEIVESTDGFLLFRG